MNALIVSNIGGVQIQTDAEFLKRRDELLASAKEVTAVSDEFTQSIAVESARDLSALAKLVEKSRVDFKAPILDLGRAIDAKAKELATAIETEVRRITSLVTAFQTEQRKRAEEAERARQAELQRIELERQKAEQEALKAKAEAEAAFTRKEKQAAEVLAKEQEQKRVELRRQQLAAQSPVMVAPPKAEGLVVKDVWRFEVRDLNGLVAARPDLCRIEANASAINTAIRNGAREIPGLFIWKETKTEVRQ